MGLGGIGLGSLLLILLIVLLIFGAKHIRNLGGDLGAALKNFRKGLNENQKDDKEEKKDDEKK